MVPLADIPGDSRISQARGMSGDGRIIVGNGDRYAAVWRDGVPESLGGLEGYRTLATDCSDDGSVIVGTAQVGPPYNAAIVWTQSTGFVLLTDYLRSHGVDIPSDLGLFDVWVSSDGRTFAGRARSTDASISIGYVATIPSPPGFVLGLCVFVAAPRRRRLYEH